MSENCKDCQGQSSYVTYNVPKDCDKLPIKDCKPIDSACVFYTSSPLASLGISESNPTAEFIFQKIDEVIGGISGASYAGYNTFCLDPVTTPQEFVESISEFVCQLRDDVDAINISASTISTLTSTVSGITDPNLSLCSYIGTTTSSTLNEILVAISDKVCELHSSIDISSVDWDLAYTVLTPPTTIGGGFDEIIRQIVLLKDSVPSAVSLPTFNTVLSCLPTKTSNTPLSTVIPELIQKVCSTASFSPEGLFWGCIVPPSTPTLTDTIQEIIDSISVIKSASPLFNTDHFDISTSGCVGTTVSIKDSVLASPMVAVEDGATPGYLKDVLVEGNGIKLTSPSANQIQVETVESGKVKVSSQGTAKYLNNSIQGGSSNGLTISVQESGDKVVLTPQIDEAILADNLLSIISNNPTLMAKLCNMICQCNNC